MTPIKKISEGHTKKMRLIYSRKNYQDSSLKSQNTQFLCELKK